MKGIFAGTVLLLGAAFGSAPDTVWVTKLHIGHDEYGQGVASRGNAIVAAGYVYGGPTVDWLVARYDQRGDFVWARTFHAGGDEEAYSTCLDRGSNMLVAGMGTILKGARSLDAPRISGRQKSLRTLLQPQGQYRAYVAKYDSAGELLWVNTDTDYVALGIAVDTAGNSFVSGAHMVSDTNLDLWLAEYDRSGYTVWSKTYDFGRFETGYRLALDPAGNIVTCDYVGDSTNFDCLTLKLRPDGDTIWTRRFDRGPNDVCAGVAVDPRGNIIVTGSTAGSARAALNDALVLKYDSSGILVWSKLFSFNADNGLLGDACDSVGDIYVAGYTGTNSVYDCLTMKLDTAGGTIWSAFYGGAGDDGAADVACDSMGDPIITGYATDTTTANVDMLIAEYSPFSGVAESRVSRPRAATNSSTIIAAPDFVVSIPVPGHYDIRLCDPSGRTRQRIYSGALGEGAHRLSVAGQPAGLYFVRVASPQGGVSCQQLVLVR